MREDVRAVFHALSLLRPFDVSPVEGMTPTRVRLGSRHDGGYVMLDRFPAGGKALSFGVGANVDWDLAVAERGLRVWLFDHTIDGLPARHPNFTFVRTGLAGARSEDGRVLTLAEHLDAVVPGESGLVLKLDVEGWEWDALAAVAPETLDRFDQIVMEAHDLRLLGHAPFRERFTRAMRTLLDRFVLFHVHGNNCGGLAWVAGFPVVDVLELSFVRRAGARAAPSAGIFPTTLDSPCNPLLPDILLSFFPFLPAGGAEGVLLDRMAFAVDRVERLAVEGDLLLALSAAQAGAAQAGAAQSSVAERTLADA